MNNVGIIILNYNNWNDTYLCVRSLMKYINLESNNIYIVDNNSNEKIDINFQKEIESIKNIKLIFSTNNGGYSGGNNIGIKQAISDGCKYFMVTNNDIIFTEDSVTKLSDYLYHNDEIGIIGPKVFRFDGSLQDLGLHYDGTLHNKYKSLINKISKNLLFKKYNSKVFANRINVEENIELYYVSGCCFMFSEKVLDLIYPLDENFFLFYEEYNLGRIMKNHDYKVLYFADTSVIHTEGKSTKKIGIRSYIYLIQSEYNYFVNIRKSSRILFFPIRLFRFLSLIKNIVFRKGFFRHFKTYRVEMMKVKRMKYNYTGGGR